METIVPMLELKNTALLAISTPLDEFNYYSKLVEQKDDHGKPFFKTIKAGRICADCSLLPYEEMLKCDHVADGAHWKSKHKLQRLKTLFENDAARGLRELGGEIASDFTACFDKADIEGLFLNPTWATETMPRFIYMAIDPNGGGASKMGITSGYHDGVNGIVSCSLLSNLRFVVVVVVVVVAFGPQDMAAPLAQVAPGAIGQKARQQLSHIVAVGRGHVDVHGVEHFLHLAAHQLDKGIKGDPL